MHLMEIRVEGHGVTRKSRESPCSAHILCGNAGHFGPSPSGRERTEPKAVVREDQASGRAFAMAGMRWRGASRSGAEPPAAVPLRGGRAKR